MTQEAHKYGAGKFKVHQNYIDYMEMIVDHEAYAGMPNVRQKSGKINWQVSSGKTTSFYKDYLARKEWWNNKTNKLQISQLAGAPTIAARMIHPTGYRACRLCGKDRNVGYFYIAKNFSKKLHTLFTNNNLNFLDPISALIAEIQEEYRSKFFSDLFPERSAYFAKYGVTTRAFEKSNYIKSKQLSPGYMGNPPDRLDGFHDYCVYCRKKNDPGRADDKMKIYNRDRRSFEWWAEGNWMIANALYNSAGKGTCSVYGCNKVLEKVSPDHVGPLSCGFKQLPFFVPMCSKHNSQKNRRFTKLDVERLLDYEIKYNESVASWQVRAHWNTHKNAIKNNDQAKSLSNSMRSLQDMYINVLVKLYKMKKFRLLATFLNPEYALLDVTFLGLNKANLEFSSVKTSENLSSLRRSQYYRTIRIAFEALEDHAISQSDHSRKLVRQDFRENKKLIDGTLGQIGAIKEPEDANWIKAFDQNSASSVEFEKLLPDFEIAKLRSDQESRALLHELFDEIGKLSKVDFDRYEN